MKSGAPNHPKFHDLAERVHALLSGRSLGAAAMPFEMAHTLTVGLMERLWQFTEEYAPAGDVGRFSPARIANAIGWPTDMADAFLKAALEVRLLDRREDGVLLIHGWSDHANNFVHASLARRTQLFADGARPKMKHLNSQERADAEKAYERLERETAKPRNRTGAIKTQENGTLEPPPQSRGESTTKKVVPSPSPSPSPSPMPPPPPHAGGGRGGGGSDEQASEQEPEPTEPDPDPEFALPPPKPGRDELAKRLVDAGVNRVAAEILAGRSDVTPDFVAFAVSKSKGDGIRHPGKLVESIVSGGPDKADGWVPWRTAAVKTRARRLDELFRQAERENPRGYTALVGKLRAVWDGLDAVAQALGERVILSDAALCDKSKPAYPVLEVIAAAAV